MFEFVSFAVVNYHASAPSVRADFRISWESIMIFAWHPIPHYDQQEDAVQLRHFYHFGIGFQQNLALGGWKICRTYDFHAPCFMIFVTASGPAARQISPDHLFLILAPRNLASPGEFENGRCDRIVGYTHTHTPTHTHTHLSPMFSGAKELNKGIHIPWIVWCLHLGGTVFHSIAKAYQPVGSGSQSQVSPPGHISEFFRGSIAEFWESFDPTNWRFPELGVQPNHPFYWDSTL